jgi:hypothetical protein
MSENQNLAVEMFGHILSDDQPDDTPGGDQ